LSEQERIFYRIIRADEAVIDNFKSAKSLGKPLRDPLQARAWEFGVSVFDSLEYTKARARAFKFLLGRWIVPVRIPRDAGVEMEQSGNDRHHFTLYSTPELLLSLAGDDPIAVNEV
jgi:hypothetical protein